MKELFIKEINRKKVSTLAEADHLLETQTVTNSIDTINWKDFSYLPNVKFRIGHVKNEIWLKFYVSEKHILARETKTNGEVYKDSCVEFFISVDNNNYYNFEFSCIGTIHLAHGESRNNRKFVDPAIVEKIKIVSSLGNQPFEEKSGNFEWEMMILPDGLTQWVFSWDTSGPTNPVYDSVIIIDCTTCDYAGEEIEGNLIITENYDPATSTYSYHHILTSSPRECIVGCRCNYLVQSGSDRYISTAQSRRSNRIQTSICPITE